MAGGAGFFPEFQPVAPVAAVLSGQAAETTNGQGGIALPQNEAANALGMRPRGRIQPVTQVLGPQPPG